MKPNTLLKNCGLILWCWKSDTKFSDYEFEVHVHVHSAAREWNDTENNIHKCYNKVCGKSFVYFHLCQIEAKVYKSLSAHFT